MYINVYLGLRNFMTNKITMRALIDLSPISMTKIANHAGVDQANLSAWFTQDRYLSDDAIERVKFVLGVDDDQLTTSKVFVWRVGRDFGQLQHLVKTCFDKPKLMPLVKKRVKRYELSDLFSQPMATLTDESGHKALLILKTSTVKDAMSDARKLPWFSPEYLEDTEWLKPIQDNSRYPFPPPLQASAEAIHEWKKGFISITDFNEMFRGANVISWEQVIDAATELGLKPAQVMDWLRHITTGQK